MAQKVFERVYEVVKKIPKGRVMTYGEVAKLVGTSPRVVGWALHANKDPENIPCHRVVGKGGVLKGYAFGGWEVQANKLTEEGVKLKGGRIYLLTALPEASRQ